VAHSSVKGQLMNKTCSACGASLPIEQFYKCSTSKDGRFGRCKECVIKAQRKRYDTKRHDDAWVWSERNRRRESAKRIGRKRVNLPDRSPTEKQLAQRPARNALIKRLPPCEKGKQYHHWSYAREDAVNVFSFTLDEHRRIHRYMVWDAEQLKYRRLDGVLLDTRVAAQRYYDYVLSLQDGEYPVNPPS